jgi:hypothetical protein
VTERILLANVVAVVHALFSAFIIGGCVALGAGRVMRWRWITGRALRGVHLGCIGFIALRTWMGMRCPLNVLETWLRRDASEDLTLVRACHWAFFKSVDPRQFAVCVTFVALLVLADFVCTYKQRE